jgi:hypothetical protein
MGHFIKDDFNMLSRTLNVHADVFETVVRMIETQRRCSKTGFWSSRQQADLLILVCPRPTSPTVIRTR